jgi:maleylacetoacetate isomerase
MTIPVLYDYWRSSAAYRIRIALNLKGIAYESVVVDLLEGEHKGEANLARNPQGLVPALEIDGLMLTQSVPILEYLDETHPDPALLPDTPRQRHKVRAIAAAIAMEIHPVCNLSVAKHAASLSGADDAMGAWMRHFIPKGLRGVEELIAKGREGGFCHRDTPGLADCCLMPQMYNARRWEVDLDPFPILREIKAHCNELKAFQMAHPDVVKTV